MSKVVARSIFHTAVVERSWKNYLTSAVVHAVVIGAAFLIVVPAVQVFREPTENRVTLLAPVIPAYHPKIQPPRVQHTAKLTPPVAPPPPVIRRIPPPVIPPPKPAVKAAAAQPVIPKSDPRIMAEATPTLSPPKPMLKTGSFEEPQPAKAANKPKEVVVGGFGDPRGASASDRSRPSPVLMARVGNFDSPQGEGKTGEGGRLDRGSVKQSGFGSATEPNGVNKGSGRAVSVQTGSFGNGETGVTGHGATGVVRSSGFGEATAPVPQHRELASTVPTFTPVEILFKPKPSYSAEARSMRLEGQVSLEVVFQASGAVRIVRVIRGLGHGLDEAAEQAAMQVRFKPATRSGAPVDTNATISITFELT